MKIYVATSWNNPQQPEVVATLRAHGYDVYDFRRPAADNSGFSWKDVEPDPKPVKLPNGGLVFRTMAKIKAMLSHPKANEGFQLDMAALDTCDVVVLVLPCGASAHLELGYAVGRGKIGFVLGDDEHLARRTHSSAFVNGFEPELMHKVVEVKGSICTRMADLLDELYALQVAK